MKKTLLIISTVLITSAIFAQTSKSPFFLGLQPGVTKEKFYSKSEFDVNIIPIVFQIPIAKKIDFRVITLANYHFGGGNQFSDIGIQTVYPVYFKKKKIYIVNRMDFILHWFLGEEKTC